MSEKYQLSKPHSPRAQWRTRMGFILAALGSAVGLGNIWRFSYLCYKNGGGAFLIPYIIALFIVGIPLMILELGFGHKMRGAAPMSFAQVNKKWEWCGWWAVNCAMFGIMLYYSVIIAWCLSYVFFSAKLSWGADPNHFFYHNFLQLSSGPLELGDIRTNILFALFSVWFICWIVVYFGVQRGIERANKFFMPVLFFLITILIVWSINLKGAHLGLDVYLKPDFSLLNTPQIWIDAFSQIFFTLSLAFGIMITYASYLPRKADIVQDALVISIGNCLFSFMAGFAVFGTLGYMALTLNKPVADVVQESIGLAFIAYPKAISLMPAFSSLFGILFFMSLVIAGLSSGISLVEAFSSAVIDKFHFARKKVVSAVCLSGFVGSILFASKGGLFWVDILDHFITHYGLVIVGVMECVLVAWLFRARKMRLHIAHASHFRLIRFWDISVKYLLPLILSLMLINDLMIEIKSSYGGYPWKALIWGPLYLLLALAASVVISMLAWKKEIVRKTMDKEPISEIPGFNFGAFSLPLFWLLFHKRIGTAALVLLIFCFCNIVASTSLTGFIVAAFISLSLMLYLGEFGNSIAYKAKNYKSLEELKAKQKIWNIIGVVFLILGYIPLLIALIVISRAS